MGAFDDRPPITVPDPTDPVSEAAFRKKWGWEPHEQVMVKGTVTVSDQIYVSDHYIKSTRKGDVEMQAGQGRYALLDRMIMDWSLLRNGQKVPVTPANIRLLPANYSNPLLEIIDQLAANMNEQEQEDFLPSANGHIVEGSSGGNLLQMRS